MIERTATEIRAFLIVHAIAHHGADAAIAHYGADACNRARFTLRACIAKRQADRARQKGARAKAWARKCARRAAPVSPRTFEAISRRAYRAAARHDATHMTAHDRAHRIAMRMGPTARLAAHAPI